MHQRSIVPVFTLGFHCLVILIMSLVVMGCSPSVTIDVSMSPSPSLTQGVSPSPESTPTQSVSPSSMVTATREIRATPSPTPSPTPDVFREALPLGGISYVLPLTVLHVTGYDATLFFELEAPAIGSLFVRSIDGESLFVEKPLSPSQIRHQFYIDGLTPGDRYEVIVAIQSDGGHYEQPAFLSRVWGTVRFRTIAENGVLRFGVIGDASFGDSATEALVQQMANSNLDFVLHTGDVVDETEQGVDPFDSYSRKYYVPFEPLLTQMPVYKVIGNHDYEDDIRWQGDPFYYYAFPAFADPGFPGQEDRARNQYYAFAQRGIQFVMLDSQVLFGVAGREEQDNWLAERLADPSFKATIPVFHVPPFGSSSVHPSDSLPVRRSWAPLFESANVTLAFCGHFHQYERLYSQGTTYIVTGGGSSILYATDALLAESEVYARKTHFVLVEAYGMHMRLTAIALGGEIIDQIELSLD
jgi:predicted phosphodiesterase